MTDRERRELIEKIRSISANSKITNSSFSNLDKFYLSNVNNKWYSYAQALETVRQLDHEQQLRAQHPSLDEAWQVYQALLGIVDPDSAKQDPDKA